MPTTRLNLRSSDIMKIKSQLPRQGHQPGGGGRVWRRGHQPRKGHQPGRSARGSRRRG